jgi:hypothetical protein
MMITLEHAGRRVAPMIVAALLAAACNNRDLTAPLADAVVQAPPTEPPGQSNKTRLSFRGEVDTVNMAAQSVTLTDGSVLQFTADTRIPQGSDVQSLRALSALAASDVIILARGYGEVITEEPLVIAAGQVSFRIEK